MKPQLFLHLILLLLVVVRYQQLRPVYEQGDLVQISTKVNSEPIQYENAQYLKLVNLKIYLPKYPQVYYGDDVVVRGTVQDDKLEDPVLLEQNSGASYLYVLRRNIVDFYRQGLPQPYNSLVAGVVLGSKGSVPQQFWDKLKHTGTVHIVVASGTNVSIVAGYILLLLLHFFNRKISVITALSGIWVYALLSGFDAPIVRASIMGSLTFGSQLLGRMYLAMNSLFLSALLMLVVNPYWIRDWGFIMSFLATLALIVFEPSIRRKLSRVPVLLREGLSTSIAAQIGVAPVLVFAFNQFNWLSPIYNMLILWTVPPITILGMFAGLLSLLSVTLGQAVLYLVFPFAYIFVKMIDIFYLL